MMDAEKRVRTERDFIALKRFNYSLKALKERYPDDAPNHVIAAALLVTEDDVETTYGNIVLKIRKLMKVEEPSC